MDISRWSQPPELNPTTDPPLRGGGFQDTGLLGNNSFPISGLGTQLRAKLCFAFLIIGFGQRSCRTNRVPNPEIGNEK